MRDVMKLVGLVLLLGACDDSAAGKPDATVESEVATEVDPTADASPETTAETVIDTGVEPDTTPPETDTTAPGELAPPAQGFQIKSPPITVPSGTEETYCYYFSLPVDAEVGVKRWQSQMTAGSHHLILYLTAEADKPDGTIVKDCDGFGGGITNVPVWTYSSQTRAGEMAMPKGVGMTVKARQHGYIQMHYLNPTLEPLEVAVAINGETFAPEETYIRAAAFVTYNTQIQIPGGVGKTASAEGTCRVKPGISFFALSTHAHRRAVATTVLDADSIIFESDDWEHPGSKRWDEPGYSFAGNLTYRCDYVNDSASPVVTGPSANTNEMCMAVGYFYPAQRPVFCINSLVVSQ